MTPAAQIKNTTSYRVIYGDTDQMGVVYYANYFRWFEKGRSEFLRAIGLPYSAIEERGFNFPVVEAECRYLRSACYDDEVHIETCLVEVRRASLSFDYRILRASDARLLATGSTKHACLHGGGRVSRVPEELRNALENAAP